MLIGDRQSAAEGLLSHKESSKSPALGEAQGQERKPLVDNSAQARACLTFENHL
jgi:hypothetical protein